MKRIFPSRNSLDGHYNQNKTFMYVFLMAVLNGYSTQLKLSTHQQNNHPKIEGAAKVGLQL